MTGPSEEPRRPPPVDPWMGGSARDRGAMPVLFVASHALDGGAERHLDRLLHRLGRDWVAIVVTLGHGPLVSWLTARGFPVRVIATSGRRGLLISALRL